jgi:peptide chain release factor 2
MSELKQNYQQLKEKVLSLIDKLNLHQKNLDILSFEKKASQPDFWNDSQNAQKIMRQLNALKDEVEKVQSLDKLVHENLEAINLYGEEISVADEETLDIDYQKAEKALKKLELQTFFTSPYDRGDAIFSIHAGQGGTEACDWASMLQRMYLRYFELKGWKAQLVDMRPGDEAGIKSVSYIIEAPYAYGYLKGEKGVHRLVRLSPFNADNLRQTSFAGVEVLPMVEEESDFKVNEEEIQFEAFRSGGHGGQNVNKVSTAVRLKHLPTGITVECQSQRSQEQNRKIALQLLKAKLWAIEEEKKEKELAQIKGEHKVHGWGNQIRSYVLHPYQMVKDLRTGIETSNTQGVLDGEIDEFIQAEVGI